MRTPLDIGKHVYAHLQEVTPELKHYFGLLSLFGVLKLSEAAEDTAFRDEAVAYLRRFPDHIEHGKYNFPNYRLGGLAPAYALFRRYMTDDEPVRLVREYAEEAMTAPRDRMGIVKGPWKTARNVIWIDNAMAITPFLLYAGLYFKEQRYVDEAAAQTLKMYDVFLDPANGLLHQSKDEIAAGVITNDHWGRGNGWGYIALTELLQYLPHDHPERARVEEYFGRHSYAMLLCQNDHDVWCQELTCPTSYEESTATGLILYGFSVGLRLDYLHPDCFGPAYRAGMQAMVKRFIGENYEIKSVCPGCRTPGDGRLKGRIESYINRSPVTDDLHGHGPVLLTMAEAVRQGIREF